MKINLSTIDTNNFFINNYDICGENCYLIKPKDMGCAWTKDNLHFRSSLWNSSGELISASFKKFFNWGERPDLTYTPFSLTANGGCNLIEKIDGSTLITSYYKNNFIARTRNTVDASKLKNGHEIEFIKNKYPKILEIPNNWSYIYEWVSPTNKIILNYGDEPDLYLIGVISHDNYNMMSQPLLDEAAYRIGVKRPRKFYFSSIKEMIESIDTLVGKEGLCLYCNKDQDIRKIKSAWYLSLHRMKSELGSLERVLDLFLELNKPDYQTFYNFVCTTFDYEIAEQCKASISKICDAYKEVLEIINHMNKFVNSLDKTNRKDCALKILSAYGNTNRSYFAFSLLDSKPLDDEQLKKLLYQVLK